MADQYPGRMGAGSFVTPMPRGPPPQIGQAMPPPAPPYPPFAHIPFVPQGVSGLGQMHQQPQQHQHHPSYFGPPFPGPRPMWTGNGFQGPPPPFAFQGTRPMSLPGLPTKSLPGTVNSTQSSTGTGAIQFDQRSFNNSYSQNVSQVTSLGHNTVLPPGIEPAEFRSSSGSQVPHDISGVTSSDVSTRQSSVTDGGFVGSRPAREKHQLVNVVEQAVCESGKEKSFDVKEVLSQLRSLLSQVEKVAKQVEALVNIDVGSGKASTVACPFDPAHKIIAEGLFQHSLRCPSNPKAKVVAALITESRGKWDTPYVAAVNNRLLNSELGSGATGSSETDFDVFSSKFFYDGASAVVQAPFSTVHAPSRDSPPAPVIESDSACSLSLCRNPSVMLPSRYFFLSKEIEGWEEFPSRTSSLVLEAAVGLGKVGRREILDWFLLHSPTLGVVVGPSLGCHMQTLARACFQDVEEKALALINQADYKRATITSAEGINDGENMRAGGRGGFEMSVSEKTADVQTNIGEARSMIADTYLYPRVDVLNCEGVFESLSWLSAKLCSLYGASESKKLTLNVLKHSLVLSGRLLSFPFLGTSVDSRSKVEDNGRKDPNPAELDGIPSEPRVVSDAASTPESMVVRSSYSLIQEMEAAISAVNERAVLERYLRNPFPASRLPKFQLLQEYEAAIRLAAEERLKRPNYRPVLESDGLIWHRSQLEEKNKNKTREELLAEERDYKRRRMSYRGKKLKRTPTQVVRDIIEGHMEEIAAAGGIGCAVKVPSAVLQASKVELSIASSERAFAGVGQRRMSSSNSSSVGRTQFDYQIYEKVRAVREPSHHSETRTPNEGSRVSSRDMNISRVEDNVVGESAREDYQLNVDDNIAPDPKSRNRAESSGHSDHGDGISTSFSYRSSSDDKRGKRRDTEDRNVRGPSHHRHEAGVTKKPDGSDMHHTHSHHDTRDYKSRRDYDYDFRKSGEDQAKNRDLFDRYGDGEDPMEGRNRRRNDALEGRKRKSTWDKNES